MPSCWSMLKMYLHLVFTLAALVGWDPKQTFALTQLGLTSEHFFSWVATGRARTSIFHKSWLISLTNVFKKAVKPLYFQLKAGTSWKFAGGRIGEMVLNCLTSLVFVQTKVFLLQKYIALFNEGKEWIYPLWLRVVVAAWTTCKLLFWWQKHTMSL